MVHMTATQLQRDVWVPELTFAARLALVRHQMGWNIKEAALACGVRPQSWRGWELEHRIPHDQVRVAREISERTGVDYDWLLSGPDRGGSSVRPVTATQECPQMSESTRIPTQRQPRPNDGASLPTFGGSGPRTRPLVDLGRTAYPDQGKPVERSSKQLIPFEPNPVSF